MFKNKPKSLLILGILTILNTSLALINGITSLISGPPSAADIKKENLEMAKSIVDFKKLDPPPEAIDLIEKIQQISTAVNDNFMFFTGISTLFSVIGFVSVFLMFRKEIYGFHAYIVYSILSSISIYFILSPSEVPTPLIVVNLLFSGLFIFLYSKNISWIQDKSIILNSNDSTLNVDFNIPGESEIEQKTISNSNKRLKNTAILVTIIATICFLISSFLLTYDPIGKSSKDGILIFTFFIWYSVPIVLWIIYLIKNKTLK